MRSHDRRGEPLAVRVYRRSVRLLPRELREAHGEEAVRLFARLHEDAHGSGGRAGAAWFATAAWLRLLQCALQARREHRADARGTTSDERRGGDVMGTLWQDLRFAARTLIKRPGFAVTAVAILAVGIGATTTIFSVVDTVVLRALPYPESGTLLHFDEGAHSYPSFRSWSAMSSFDAVTAARDMEVDLTEEGPPLRLPAAAISQGFFEMFGGAPRVGRLFTADEYPGDRSVAVLSHGLYERLGGSPSLLEREIRLDGTPTRIVGVLDPSFVPPALESGSRVDVWYPLDDNPEDRDEHGLHTLGVAAQLATGVSLEAAQAEVDAQRRAIAEQFPNYYLDRGGEVETTPLVPMHEATVRNVRGTLFLLFGAVGMMLLIACANVANLFLARGTARTREVALRGALGASRRRIAAQVLTESLLLAVVGGALGVAVAYAGVEVLATMLPADLPRLDTLGVDERVLLFSLAASVLTGVVFGTVPSLQAVRADINEALKDGAASVSAGTGGRRVRSGLVVVEIALAMVLLTGAGLLFRSFVAMVQVDPGFDVEGLVVMPLELDAGYDGDRRALFLAELEERVEAIPGTRSMTVGWTLPFTMTGRSRCCWRTRVSGDPELIDEDRPFRGMVHPVTAGYFGTLGARVAYGRDFTELDDSPESSTAILNVGAAQWLFGGDNAVGRVLRLRDMELEVVGVVDGVHHWGLSEGVEEALYVPFARFGTEFGRMQVLIRTEAPLEAAAGALRAAVWEIDPDLPIREVVTMGQRISSSLTTPRFLSGIFGAFAVVALLLACGGIYGSMLYTVGQRRREMGIRLALGAGGRTVVGMILRYGALLAALGVVLGLVAAWQLARFMEQMVWGVGVTDPLTFVSTAIVLGLTAIGASFVPAFRAARTSPLETLRAE